MHTLIRFLVIADSEEEATERATEELETLTERGKVDYGGFCKDKDSRWHMKHNAFKVTSKAGREFLIKGLMFDYKDSIRHLREIRTTLNEKSDHEIMTGDWMKRYTFKQVDDSRFIVYDNEFINAIDLKLMLEDKDVERLWMVPCDVHT